MDQDCDMSTKLECERRSLLGDALRQVYEGHVSYGYTCKGRGKGDEIVLKLISSLCM